MKPGDEHTVPLCHEHHRIGHDCGWQTFERKYGLDLKKAAERFAENSPVLKGRFLSSRIT